MTTSSKLVKSEHSESGALLQGLRTILDLPNEILCLIFSDVEENDIISIGCLSRRLNQVAFGHHFFKARSTCLPFADTIWSDSSTFYIGAYKDTIWSFRTFQAIRLSLFATPKIMSLNTRFSWSFPDEARQVCRFFETKPTLQSIVIELPYGPGPAGLNRGWEKKGVELPSHELVRHRTAVYQLLSSLSFVKADPMYMTRELTLEINQGVALDDASLGAEFPPFSGPLFTSATTMSLSYSSFLFRAPFQQWTIASMNHCRLRRLVMEDIDVGPLLDQLKLESLRDVVFRSRSVTQRQLNGFLSRHPTLTDIIVFRVAPLLTEGEAGFAEEKIATRDAISDGALPNVRELTIPGDYLASWVSVPSTLRSLQSIRIERRLLPSNEIPKFHRTLQYILSELVKRSCVRSVNLPFCVLSETPNWLNIPLADRAEPKLVEITRVDIALPCSWKMTADRLDRLIRAVALFPALLGISVWPAIQDTVWRESFRKLAKVHCPNLKWTMFDFEKFPCDHLSKPLGEDDDDDDIPSKLPITIP